MYIYIYGYIYIYIWTYIYIYISYMVDFLLAKFVFIMYKLA